MLVPILIPMIFASAAIYGFGYLHAEISHSRSFWKTLPVGLMALFAAVVGGPWVIILALVLSAIGDYFLSRDESKFTIGLISFLLAHVLYIIFFWQLGSDIRFGWGHAAMLAYALIFGAYLWPRAGEFRIPVLAYVVVITLMVSVALFLDTSWNVVIIGTFAFALSDSVLALEMFVVKAAKTKRMLAKIVWVTYVVAQALIVFGLLGYL